VLDAYSQLRLTSFSEVNSGIGGARGSACMKRGNQFQMFRYYLSDTTLSVKAAHSQVTGCLNLNDVERVLKGESSKGLFMALCNSAGLEMIFFFFSDFDANARQLYLQLCNSISMRMRMK
jgi:hypothetical protein